MRLYLSSFDLGNRPEALSALAGDGRKAAVIMNALDNRPESRAAWLRSQTDGLVRLGFDVRELDLRTYFDKPDGLTAALQYANIVWINGGNAFLLRRAMRQSGFDTAVRRSLAADEIVYAGFSAAAVIAAPDLHGLDLIDDPNDVAPGYDPEVIWEGLGLCSFSIAVHFESHHSESALVAREIAFYEKRGTPYRTLRDGEALIIDGGRLDVVG